MQTPGRRPSLHFVHENGTLFVVSNDWDDKRWCTSPRKKRCVKSICSLPANFFNASRMSVLVPLRSYNPDTVHGIEREAFSFQIMEDVKSQSPACRVRRQLARSIETESRLPLPSMSKRLIRSFHQSELAPFQLPFPPPLMAGRVECLGYDIGAWSHGSARVLSSHLNHESGFQSTKI
jgi:hypothetical protein